MFQHLLLCWLVTVTEGFPGAHQEQFGAKNSHSKPIVHKSTYDWNCWSLFLLVPAWWKVKKGSHTLKHPG